MQNRLALIVLLTALLATLKVWLAAQPFVQPHQTARQTRAREELERAIQELQTLLGAIRTEIGPRPIEAARPPRRAAPPRPKFIDTPTENRLTAAIRPTTNGPGPPILGPPSAPSVA